MQLKFNHNFSKQEARARVEHVVREAPAQLGDKGSIEDVKWDGDTMTATLDLQGQKIPAVCIVGDKEYDITITLPFMMRLFEGKLKGMIESQVQQMLGK